MQAVHYAVYTLGKNIYAKEMGAYRGYKFWTKVFSDFDLGKIDNVSEYCIKHNISRTIFYRRLKMWQSGDTALACGKRVKVSKVKAEIEKQLKKLKKRDRPSVRELTKTLNRKGIKCGKSIVGKYM